MESYDESIELLKMRMHHQMNASSGNDIKPENIQYYVSSLIMQKEDIHQKESMYKNKDTQQAIHVDEDRAIYQIVYEKLQNGEKLSEKENEILRQKDQESYRKAKDIERENEEYRQRLGRCRTKEDVHRAEEEYRQSKRRGLTLTENNDKVPVERKLEHTLFKDAKISAIRNLTRQFAESEEYTKLPTDEEYIRKSGEHPSVMDGIKVPENMEVQHERAKNEYEKVLQAVDDEEIYGFRRPHWLNIKG